MATTYKTRVFSSDWEFTFEPSPMQGFRLSVERNGQTLNDASILHLGSTWYESAYDVLCRVGITEENTAYILFKAAIPEPEFDYDDIDLD